MFATLAVVVLLLSPGGSTTPPNDPTLPPRCEDVFSDGSAPSEADYEAGCVVTFERYECARDGSVRYLSMLGTGRVGGNFLPRSDPAVVIEYCTGADQSGTTVAPEPPSTTVAPEPWERDCPGPRRKVSYYADGDGTLSGSITAAMPDGTQQADVALPMKNTGGTEGIHFCAPPGEFVYLSVQNRSRQGAVTCRIEVDGRQLAENTSRGGYVIATCDGTVPLPARVVESGEPGRPARAGRPPSRHAAAAPATNDRGSRRGSPDR